MAETETRRRFSEITWADIGQQVYPRNSRHWEDPSRRPLYWTDQHELGVQLAEMVPHLDEQQCQLLVSYAYSGLPAVLTWTTRFNGKYESPMVETTTASVIIDYLAMPAADVNSGRIHISYLGHSHDAWLSHVTSIKAPEVNRTYETVAE
jgi:hypothetical protein